MVDSRIQAKVEKQGLQPLDTPVVETPKRKKRSPAPNRNAVRLDEGPKTGTVSKQHRGEKVGQTGKRTGKGLLEQVAPNLDKLLARALLKKAIDLPGLAALLGAFQGSSPEVQSSALKSLGPEQKVWAQTLSLFGAHPVQGEDPASRARAALAHLSINTDAPVTVPGPFAGVLKRAAEYARSLGVDSLSRKGDRIMAQIGEESVELMRIVPKQSPGDLLRAIGRALNMLRSGNEQVVPPERMGLEVRDGRYATEQAYWSAQLARLAYSEPKLVTAQLAAWGFDKVRFIDDPNSDTQAFVASNGKLSVVSYRGTSSLKDFRTDARIGKSEGHGGAVHAGFEKAHRATFDRIQQELAAIGGEQPVLFTGHSLGAALATLAANDYAAAGGKVEGVYLYGSPRVGDQRFAASYDRLLGERTFLHVNDKDVVTRVPPGLFGYVEVGRQKRIFDDQGVLRIEDLPRRDARSMMALEAASTVRAPTERELAEAERDMALAEQAIAAMSMDGMPKDARLASPALEGMFGGPFQMFGDHKSEHYLRLTGLEAIAGLLLGL